MWAATRWQTFMLMSAQNGSDWMRQSGFNNPTNLIKFTWEDEQQEEEFDENYYDEMQEMMRSVNEQNKEEAKP